MRLTTITIALLAQLASLASAAPISAQPESSPNDDAVLLPRQTMCTNYPSVVAGAYVPNKCSLPPSPATALTPRSTRVNWCRSHSNMWIFFNPGSRDLMGGPANTANLFAAILHNIGAKIGQGHGGEHLSDAWTWLGSVGGEGMYAQEVAGNGMTWSVLETAVRILQNYVAVRGDGRSVAVDVVLGGRLLGRVMLGGPQP